MQAVPSLHVIDCAHADRVGKFNQHLVRHLVVPCQHAAARRCDQRRKREEGQGAAHGAAIAIRRRR